MDAFAQAACMGRRTQTAAAVARESAVAAEEEGQTMRSRRRRRHDHRGTLRCLSEPPLTSVLRCCLLVCCSCSLGPSLRSRSRQWIR